MIAIREYPNTNNLNIYFSSQKTLQTLSACKVNTVAKTSLPVIIMSLTGLTGNDMGRLQAGHAKDLLTITPKIC